MSLDLEIIELRSLQVEEPASEHHMNEATKHPHSQRPPDLHRGILRTFLILSRMRCLDHDDR